MTPVGQGEAASGLNEMGAHMGVILVNRFETRPGRLIDHVTGGAVAVGHFRRLGMQPTHLQPIAGGDVGSILFAVNFADNAAYTSGIQAIQADEEWQEY